MKKEDIEKAVREELLRGVEVDVVIFNTHDVQIAQGVIRYSRVPVNGESIDVSSIVRGYTFGKVIHVVHYRQPREVAAQVQARV